jgi:HSP20 family protein
MAREEQRDYGLPARREETGLPRFGEPEYWSASPFSMFRRMQEDMDRMWSQFFGAPGAGGFGGSQRWAPSVDIDETENEYVVRADVPGVEAEDLEVVCLDDRLVIRGETRREEESRDRGRLRSERRYGRFERTLALPGDVKPDEIQANFRNGVLELRLPKSEESRQKARRIPIQGSQATVGSKGGEVTGAEASTAQPASEEQKQEKKS